MTGRMTASYGSFSLQYHQSHTDHNSLHYRSVSAFSNITKVTLNTINLIIALFLLECHWRALGGEGTRSVRRGADKCPQMPDLLYLFALLLGIYSIFLVSAGAAAPTHSPSPGAHHSTRSAAHHSTRPRPRWCCTAAQPFRRARGGVWAAFSSKRCPALGASYTPGSRRIVCPSVGHRIPIVLPRARGLVLDLLAWRCPPPPLFCLRGAAPAPSAAPRPQFAALGSPRSGCELLLARHHRLSPGLAAEGLR